MNKNRRQSSKQDGRLEVKTALCDFCGSCVAVCPVDCIELAETMIYIDLEVCNLCQNCIRVCPIHIINLVESEGIDG